MEVVLDALVPLFAVVAIFGMPVFIILIIFYFDKRNKEQFHSTLQKLIESGQELSPELLQSIPGYKIFIKKIYHNISTLNYRLLLKFF